MIAEKRRAECRQKWISELFSLKWVIFANINNKFSTTKVNNSNIKGPHTVDDFEKNLQNNLKDTNSNDTNTDTKQKTPKDSPTIQVAVQNNIPEQKISFVGTIDQLIEAKKNETKWLNEKEY
jgi:pyruvate kinase